MAPLVQPRVRSLLNVPPRPQPAVQPEISRLCLWWCQGKPVHGADSRLNCYLDCVRSLSSFKQPGHQPSPAPAPRQPTQGRFALSAT